MGIIEEAEKYLSEYRAQQYNTSFGYLGLIERLVDRLKATNEVAITAANVTPYLLSSSCPAKRTFELHAALAKYNGEGDDNTRTA